MQMEVIKVVGEDTQSVFPRVLAELVRRKVEVDKAFVGKVNGRFEMIFEVKNSFLNGKLLHAIRNLQDVVSAEFLKESYLCHWKVSPECGSEEMIMRPGSESG